MTDLALKFTGKDTIAGLAIPFGSKSDRDLDGEYFTANTDLCVEWYGKSGRPLLYDHGLDDAMKTFVVGHQSDFELRDEGIWAESQLDTAAKYRKAVDKLIDQGALGYSSGAMQHLATKSKTGEITRWPWVELSMTPIPAHPATLIHHVKSATAMWADTVPDPESLADHLARVSDEVRQVVTHSTEHVDMRVKAGRTLSRSNRDQIRAVLDALAAIDPHRESLSRLYDETDPDRDPEAEKALNAAVFEALAVQARLMGVPI